jgi:hypothetical protein
MKQTSDSKYTLNKTCKKCKFHDDFTGACCNGYSEHCADFTDDEDSCRHFENNTKK